MRKFSLIDTRFWIDPAMQQLSPKSRLIALYLVHATLLGCFRLPNTLNPEETSR
jgi:hypothetical protein